MSAITPNEFAWLLTLSGAAIFAVGVVILGMWLSGKG
jgi:hypothetical protein